MSRLAALRAELDRLGVDGFFIPRADEFQNEYVPANAERLAFVTGFTGSSGVAVVLRDKAAVFTDPRYQIQVREQVEPQGFAALITATPGDMDLPQRWVMENLPAGSRIGFDPWLHPQGWAVQVRQLFATKGITLAGLLQNPVDAIWQDRPQATPLPYEIHPPEFAGESSASKRQRMAAQLKENGLRSFAITKPESVAWLLNIRGFDTPHAPLPLSFALIHDDGQMDLFADDAKVTPELRQALGNTVAIRPAADFASMLQALCQRQRVATDPRVASAALFELTEGRLERFEDVSLLMRIRKNETEQEGMRRAHTRDGVALVRFLHWLEQNPHTDELTLTARLEELRREGAHYRDLSFDTIAGSGPHGAIMHYRGDETSNRQLQPGEFLLLDSGAQYRDGTTDVTRTIAIGEASAEMKDRYTRVLKGHIALAMAVFPEGTTGHRLDALARLPLWELGLDFGHGTGHGVGSYLSVHEIPPRVTRVPVANSEFYPGMVVSNEPGYYKEGQYGIRLENLIMTQPVEIAGAEQRMLRFETLTLCPFDTKPVVTSLLLPHERDWLNTYHARVRAELTPLLNAADAHWLEQATRPI